MNKVGRLCHPLVCELAGKGFLCLFVISAQCDNVSFACSGGVCVYPFVSSVGSVFLYEMGEMSIGEGGFYAAPTATTRMG